MTPSAADGVLQLIDGFWRKLEPAQSAAFHEWLLHTRASEDQVREALTKLYNDGREFAPKPSHVNTALKEMGALGEPVPGQGDPRVIAAMREYLGADARNIAGLRGCSLAEATEAMRAQTAEIISDYAVMYPDRDEAWDTKGYWADRLTALESLLREGAA